MYDKKYNDIFGDPLAKSSTENISHREDLHKHFKSLKDEDRSYLKKYAKEPEKDCTLDLTVPLIEDKIFRLTGTHVSEDWILENFKDAITSCRIETKSLSFEDYIRTKMPAYKNEIIPTDAMDTIDYCTYVYATFDVLKTIEILSNKIADRLIWNEFHGPSLKEMGLND